MTRPICKTCILHAKHCKYSDLPPKPRPSKALIRAAEKQNRDLEQLLVKLKLCSQEQREALLATFDVIDGKVRLIPYHIAESPSLALSPEPGEKAYASSGKHGVVQVEDLSNYEDDEDDDAILDEHEISQYLSIDEHGQINAFGPTSALHNPIQISQIRTQSVQNLANQLFVNAAVQRQLESSIWSLSDIDGVPIELATHLHDLHWNRQHHGFLLTYRPVYTRDLISGGPLWSKFLSNAIFASASKFSTRTEVRDDPNDPRTSGSRFLRRCEELLAEDSPFDKSTIPTVIGLMLLSSSYLARGEVSKSWKYCGLAIRTVFDLGLHLDCERPGLSAEDVEISRRVFWGVFVWDKMQSLYLGRPVGIQLRDAYVSCNFMDTLEENEPWTPYIDPNSPCPDKQLRTYAPTPLHSVSCFQHLCSLSKIMTQIVSRFYVAGARIREAKKKMQYLDHAVNQWRAKLPSHLVFEPVLDQDGKASSMVAPNIILLNITYHAVLILLHRPFISNINLHQGSPSKQSWEKCTTAAKSITNKLTAYRTAYTLRGAPYLASYACYVACTIHVRNVALEREKSASSRTAGQMVQRTLGMLNELSESSPCATRASQIITRLMEANQLQGFEPEPVGADVSPMSAFDVDAIMRMFPTAPRGPGVGDGQEQTDIYALLELSEHVNYGFTEDPLLHDPLFGFMDRFDLANGVGPT